MPAWSASERFWPSLNFPSIRGDRHLEADDTPQQFLAEVLGQLVRPRDGMLRLELLHGVIHHLPRAIFRQKSGHPVHVHRGVVPGRHRRRGCVPRGRDVGMRAVEDGQRFGAGSERLPVRVGPGEVPKITPLSRSRSNGRCVANGTPPQTVTSVAKLYSSTNSYNTTTSSTRNEGGIYTSEALPAPPNHHHQRRALSYTPSRAWRQSISAHDPALARHLKPAPRIERIIHAKLDLEVGKIVGE